MDETKHSKQNSLGHLTNVSSRALTRMLNQKLVESGFDVTVEQWRVLFYLWLQDGLNQNDLARKTGKKKATIVSIINVLERKNIVLRVKDKSDKRNNCIHLTTRGRELQEPLMDLADEVVRRSEEHIDPTELKICKKVLREIIQRFD